MESFDPFLSFFRAISDRRRAEGKRYTQAHILLFSILAVVTGANSYRGIRTFIRVNWTRLNEAFGLRRKRPPAHTTIRTILTGLDAAEVEAAFRAHAADLNSAGMAGRGVRVVALDGKALRGSFDAFHDSRARQILSAFATDTALVLAHIEIDDKSNEIPAAQALLLELNVPSHIITLDAMHCQKNIRSCRASWCASDRAIEGEPEKLEPERHDRLFNIGAAIECADPR